MHRLVFYVVFLFSHFVVKAQLPQTAFSFNFTNDTTLACGQNCITLKTTVPVIRAFSNQYNVSKATCFRSNVSPSAPANTLGSVDDRYSPALIIPFNFSFYGILYNQAIVSGNGAVCFDLTNANAFATWNIPVTAGSLPSTSYDRAQIMGVYQDVDISDPASPARQFKYEVTGTAPHRKWIVSFYKAPCYLCNEKINNTYQISLYEGLGLVEVHVFDREVCATWNSGGAMIGIQNYDRTNGIMAPGRSAFTTPRWGGLNMNEAWRFTPNAGAPLLKNVELYKSSGELVAAGDTANDGNGNYLVSFNNICPDAATTTYIVKSAYYHIEYPLQLPAGDSLIYATDTINVYRNEVFTSLRYPKSIYCNTENLQEAPLVDGVTGGIFRADKPGLSIDSITGVVNIAASDTGFYTVQYHIDTTNPCVIPLSFTTVRIVDSSGFVWTGAVDNNWENAANWSCNNLPVSLSNVIIYSGNVIINSNVTINKLTIMPGAHLTVMPGYNLTILNPGS